jgi:hypothetical protein
MRHALFATLPPPVPLAPDAYYIEDNVPDILVFMGFIVYGISLFFAVTDIVEQEAITFAHLDYASFPLFLIAGLMLGLVSYGLAFLARVELGMSEHSVMTAFVFTLFAKHLTRRAEMSTRKASTIISLGSLPLLCLAVLEAGSVQVRNAKIFFMLMMTFAAMPLAPLFRDWLPGASGVLSGGAETGKLRKRTFCLFFFSCIFVAVSTPLKRQAHGASTSETRQGIVVCFDLLMIYYALDGLW